MVWPPRLVQTKKAFLCTFPKMKKKVVWPPRLVQTKKLLDLGYIYPRGIREGVGVFLEHPIIFLILFLAIIPLARTSTQKLESKCRLWVYDAEFLNTQVSLALPMSVRWLVGKGRMASPKRMNFRKSSRGGVISNPKTYVADFGPLDRAFSAWKGYKRVFSGYVFNQLSCWTVVLHASHGK